MIITTMNPSLLELQHLKVISDEYEQSPREYTQVFHEMDAQSKQVTIPHIGALGRWAEGTEGSVLQADEIVEGDTATFNLVTYNNSYDVSYETRRWDQYGKMTAGPTEMVRGLNYLIESEAAGVLNDGFTVNGYDGVPLFSNTHPLASSSATADNLFTGALSYSNIQTAEQLMINDTVNESDLPIFSRPTTLWCAIGLHRAAMEILSSTNVAGEISNTKASLPPLKVAPLSLATAGYWGLKDDRLSANNLIFMWYDRPMFDTEMIPGRWKVIKVKGYAAFQPGYADWRGIVGSTGA